MEDDQELAVIFQLNLKEKNEKAISSSWENDLSSITQDLSQNKCIASDESEVNKDLNDAFEKDLEFIKKHAINADPKFLRLLLNSQSNNPNRLEMVCEILNLPNALETLKEPRKYSNDKKRSVNNIDSEAAERKKKRSDDTENYLNQITDMFPDADRLFLISECQHIKNWEDYSRFINTVMISGVYPKKEAVDYSSQKLFSNVGNAFNDQAYRVIYSSSEEEISSTDSSDLKKRKKKNTKKTVDIISIDSPELLKKKLKNPTYVSAVIDITDNDDDTESSNLPNENLEILHNKSPINKSTMEIDEASPDWTTSLDDDIDYLFQKKFRTHFLEKTNKVNLESSENLDAGLSNLSTPNTSFRFSLPSNSTLNIEDSEKSLAEIIEEKRPNRRLSLDSQNHLHNDFSKPSTSKVNDSDKTKMETVSENNVSVSSVSEVHLDELSFAKVSTTCQNDDSGNFIANETDEVSKIKEDWLDEQTANLIRIFPNTDPSYLRVEVMKMNMSSEAVNAFVVAKLENNNMPTRAEYEKRLEMEELQNRYTKNFSIEDFVKVLPDPWRYFSQGNRNCIKYKKHSLCYLKSAFKKHYVRDIIHVFNENNFNLFLTYKTLKKRETRMRGKRSEFECNNHRPTTINIQFLQEVAFIENEEKIKDYILNEEKAREIKFAEAKSTGRLLECQCCFDSEVLMEDAVYCPSDHIFCRDCIIKSVEIEFGKGKCQFECLASCEEKFTLACLQNVLKPELFSKVIKANQMEEIKAAGIEDLVQCPFCTYATIMPPEVKVLTCLNPECLKESCRLCQELNHVPLKCEEVEKSEEVKMRIYIENKMTEALVRTCYKCSKKFVKEDGCNKMACTCGATMCYICRQPVTDYSHFNGQGGTEHEKCPLYSTNDELHVDLVREIGEKAKAEILQANPDRKLLHDPTIIMPERSNDHPMPGMNYGIALNHALRGIRNELERKNEELSDDDDSTHHRHHEHEDFTKANAVYRYHRHRQREPRESDDDIYTRGNHNHNLRHSYYNPHHHHRHQHHNHHHHHHHHRD